MTQRARAAVDVQLLTRNAKLRCERHCDHGERFIHLPKIHIVGIPADLSQQLLRRWNRRG